MPTAQRNSLKKHSTKREKTFRPKSKFNLHQENKGELNKIIRENKKRKTFRPKSKFNLHQENKEELNIIIRENKKRKNIPT